MFEIPVEQLPLVYLNYGNQYPQFEYGHEQETVYHERFYAHVNPSWQNPEARTELGLEYLALHQQFVAEELVPHFGEGLMYQIVPFFRAHLPGNKALAKPHRDRETLHREEEVNVYFPFTDAFGNATVWTETQEGKGDMLPLEAKVGEIFLWNGANLLHMNHLNDTERTRLSVDFRVIKESQYQDKPAWKSRTMGVSMNVGGYFERSRDIHKVQTRAPL